VIDETTKLCHNELEPMNMIADSEGCTWVDEYNTKTPTGFKEAYDIYVESGWQGLSFPPAYGGQGMPMSMALIQSEMIAAANWTWLMFPGLSKGAINTIYSHCTDELKEKWLPPLVSGEFTGTMCLTEPQVRTTLTSRRRGGAAAHPCHGLHPVPYPQPPTAAAAASTPFCFSAAPTLGK